MTYSCYITRYMRLLYNMLHYAGVPVGVTVGHWHGGGPPGPGIAGPGGGAEAANAFPTPSY
jgi:hypothetical protein